MVDRTNRPDGDLEQAWVAPELIFDGELKDVVQGSNKPTDVTGEPGDPGHRPASA